MLGVKILCWIEQLGCDPARGALRGNVEPEVGWAIGYRSLMEQPQALGQRWYYSVRLRDECSIRRVNAGQDLREEPADSVIATGFDNLWHREVGPRPCHA